VGRQSSGVQESFHLQQPNFTTKGTPVPATSSSWSFHTVWLRGHKTVRSIPFLVSSGEAARRHAPRALPPPGC
jgi:hypothetical protein